MVDGKFNVLDWNAAQKKMNYVNLPIKGIEKLLDSFLPETICEIGDWENMDDLELLNYLGFEKFISGIVYVITEVSYVKNIGMFEMHSENIKDFINDYIGIYGECFFNGDVIFISLKYNKLLMFHHHGKSLLYNPPLLKRVE